jgi:hypothetical protein
MVLFRRVGDRGNPKTNHFPPKSPESMTRLSYQRVGAVCEAHHVGVARRSLMGLVMSCATLGCLYPDPPEYQQAEQTKPHLYNPLPPTTEILAVNANENVHISVQLSSEDAGDDVVAKLYRNYLDPVQSEPQNVTRYLRPGTADELRDITLDWTVPTLAKGRCEQLSLVVTHYHNLDEEGAPINAEDVSVVTWWLSINDSQVPITDCPGGPVGAS